jgi:hypothetical protein
MPRQFLIALAMVASAAQVVHADDIVDAPSAEMSVAHDRELGARLGLASGGRSTPGGLMVAGQYLYQMSQIDWFEGTVAFTFGGGGADCFRDRSASYICRHEAISGFAGEVSAGVRRFLKPQEMFTPYVRGLVGLRLVTYTDDEVRGLAIPVTAAVGVRAKVSELVSVGGDAALGIGVGYFNKDLGLQPQLGVTVLAGVEFRLN